MSSKFSRRSLLTGISLSPLVPFAWSARGEGAQISRRGGQLVFAVYPEPPTLTSATSTAGPAANVSPKIFDGLLSYGFDLKPKPQLATSWSVSEDGLSFTFNLRKAVRWHDGTTFTSADVAYSLEEVWKKYHSRGRSTFANVKSVETPDAQTIVLRLSKPAPYLISALASMESQILPRHLYAGSDVLSNPHNMAPVGTGPFRFAKWDRGSYLALERNADYWDQPKPYLDRLIFQFLPDAEARAAALETGEIQLAGQSTVPYSDILRLKRDSNLRVTTDGYEYTKGILFFEFNLDKPMFKDVRVRQAIAHAIDKDFIVKNIFYGFGEAATGPIPKSMKQFQSDDLPSYPFDLDRATRLLDEAGFKPNGDGIRMSFMNDPLPAIELMVRVSQYIADTMGKIGIKMTVRTQDFAGFIKRIYTDRDFDTSITGGNAAPDPAIAVQRFYWSRNFQPGVAFSNGSHYASAVADKALEDGQVSLSPTKRRQAYTAFQSAVMHDLPNIPLVVPDYFTVASSRLRDYSTTAMGINGNFAETFFASGD